MKFTHSEVVSHFKEETTQKIFQKREDDSDDNFNIDDQEADYFEEKIWALQDLNDPELSDFWEEIFNNDTDFLEEIFGVDTLDDFLDISNISALIPSSLEKYRLDIQALWHDLKKAKQAKLEGNSRLTISLCEEILKAFPSCDYAKNLLTAACKDVQGKKTDNNFLNGSNIATFIPPNLEKYKTDIQSRWDDLNRAKQARHAGNPTLAISLCNEILNVLPAFPYAKILLIATYGDIQDKRAYELAVEELNKGNTKLPFQMALYGLLGKGKIYPEDFLVALVEKLPNLLERYYQWLTDRNPKKEIIYKILHRK